MRGERAVGRGAEAIGRVRHIWGFGPSLSRNKKCTQLYDTYDSLVFIAGQNRMMSYTAALLCEAPIYVMIIDDYYYKKCTL